MSFLGPKQAYTTVGQKDLDVGPLIRIWSHRLPPGPTQINIMIEWTKLANYLLISLARDVACGKENGAL